MHSARIRTAWKNKRRPVSTEEHAVAVAAVAWRIALNAARNLHEAAFDYTDDVQRLAVMREYLYFLIHFADRRAQQSFASDPARRTRFTTRLSHECRRHYRENERDIMAPEPVAERFIEQLNRRLSAYANTRFVDDQPGYAALRALALHIREQMGHDQTNKWVLEQVLDIDGPEALQIFGAALRKLTQAADKARGEEGD